MGERGMHAAGKENPWVRDALGARRRMPAWLAVAVAAGYSVGILTLFRSQAAALQQTFAGMTSGVPSPWSDILVSGALQGMVFGLFLLFALLATGWERRPLLRPGTAPVPYLALGRTCGGLGFAAAVGLAYLAGVVTPAAPQQPLAGPIAVGAALVVAQSLAEEAFFRGWLQPIVCARWGGWIGLVVTSLLFAGLHVIAGAQGWLAVLNLFLGGLLFGLLALRTGGLLAPAAAHFAWNWTESGVLGLVPDPAGSLVQLKLAGPVLWSGGADTMNGSLATTLVLALLTGGLLLLRPRPQT